VGGKSDVLWRRGCFLPLSALPRRGVLASSNFKRERNPLEPTEIRHAMCRGKGSFYGDSRNHFPLPLRLLFYPAQSLNENTLQFRSLPTHPGHSKREKSSPRPLPVHFFPPLASPIITDIQLSSMMCAKTSRSRVCARVCARCSGGQWEDVKGRNKGQYGRVVDSSSSSSRWAKGRVGLLRTCRG